MGIVLTCAGIFKLWMMLDAMQRGGSCCGNYWIYIIIMPFGDVAYFFLVKIHDPQFAGLLKLIPHKKKSLDEIRSLACHCPSLANRRLFAAALCDEKSYEECLKVCDETLKQDASDQNVIYTKALALKALGRTEEAKFLLEALVEKNMSCLDFGPAAALCEIYINLRENNKALELAHSMAKRSGRIEHELKVIETYLDTSSKDGAKAHLNKILENYKNSPRYIQRRDKAHFKKAKMLYSSL